MHAHGSEAAMIVIVRIDLLRLVQVRQGLTA